MDVGDSGRRWQPGTERVHSTTGKQGEFFRHAKDDRSSKGSVVNRKYRGRNVGQNLSYFFDRFGQKVMGRGDMGKESSDMHGLRFTVLQQILEVEEKKMRIMWIFLRENVAVVEFK